MATRWLGIGLAGLLAACAKSQAAPEGGPRLFAVACARCHGPDGRGGIARGPMGGPAAPSFADATFQEARRDDELRHAIREGKGTGMPPFKAALHPAEIDALVTHIRALGKAEPGGR